MVASYMRTIMSVMLWRSWCCPVFLSLIANKCLFNCVFSVQDSTSPWIHLPSGVPQGSVLGPKLFPFSFFLENLFVDEQLLYTFTVYKPILFFFSSDNGGNIDQGASNWPLRGSKTTLWEGGVRAVGFVTSPLLSERMKGTVSRELIDISDWYPTLIEGVAGWTLSDTKLDGYNIWETLRWTNFNRS